MCCAFHVAGGTIELFSHGANRISTDHLSKLCVEIIRQWHNTAAQVRKCWTSFAYSLAEENTDTFLGHSRKFHVSASRDLANCCDIPQQEFAGTTRVVSELINVVNLALAGNLQFADVHVLAQTSVNCVFHNHLDLRVRTLYAPTSSSEWPMSRRVPSSPNP